MLPDSPDDAPPLPDAEREDTSAPDESAGEEADSSPTDPLEDFADAQRTWGRVIRHDSAVGTDELADSALTLWEAAGNASRIGDTAAVRDHPVNTQQRLAQYRQGQQGRTATATAARDTAADRVAAYRRALSDERALVDKVGAGDPVSPVVMAAREDRARARRCARDAVYSYLSAEKARLEFAADIAGELGAPELAVHRAIQQDQRGLPDPENPSSWSHLHRTY